MKRVRPLASRHAPIIAVLAAGAVFRALTQIAYGPALYYYDSLSYLARSRSGLFLSPDQPAGYPFGIRAVRFLGGGLGTVTVAQHIAGLATGLLVYVVIWRLSARCWLATIGAAVVVLDGYAIAIEQYLMSEALFDLLVAASAALALLGRRRLTFAASGAVLAAACLVRPVGLFCVPVWLVLALWRYRWSWTVLACAAAVLVPLLGYAAANEGATGNFALTEDTAWLLYGRIGPIGDCSGVSIPQSDRVLCPHSSQLRRSVNFYLFSPSSPAVRAFGPHLVDAPARVDRILFGYSLRVMAQRPLRYTGLVAGDLVRFFVPGARSDYPTEDGPITLPRPGPWLWPVYRPRQRVPAKQLRAYVGVVHTVRPLLALFGLLGVVALVLRPQPVRRAADPRLGAIGFLLSMTLALMVGSALSHFERRYALPTVPLLTSCGLLAAVVLRERLAMIGQAWRSRHRLPTNRSSSSGGPPYAPSSRMH